MTYSGGKHSGGCPVHSGGGEAAEGHQETSGSEGDVCCPNCGMVSWYIHMLKVSKLYIL